MSLALFVEGLCVTEMLKSAVHLFEFFGGKIFFEVAADFFLNKLHSSALCFLSMKLQLLVSEGLLLLHYTQTAIYSAKFQFWSI